MVALGKATPLLDPGGEVYTSRTFSARRYQSNVLNSFGHAVPRIAGHLQVEGRQAAARILKTDFTDRTDTLEMDIASAYRVKELKKLHRTFIFSREGTGRLTVIDEVEFSSPQQFGTALITFSPWKELEAGRLRVGKCRTRCGWKSPPRAATRGSRPRKSARTCPADRFPSASALI